MFKDKEIKIEKLEIDIKKIIENAKSIRSQTISSFFKSSKD